MEQILSVISIILAVIGLAVVVISFKLEKDRKEKIKKYQNAIKRRDARIKDLEEENTFLKHQSGYHTNWLKGLTESERTESPNEKLKGALEEVSKCDVLSNFDSLQDVIRERKKLEEAELTQDPKEENITATQASDMFFDDSQKDNNEQVKTEDIETKKDLADSNNNESDAIEIESPEEIVVIPVEATVNVESKEEDNTTIVDSLPVLSDNENTSEIKNMSSDVSIENEAPIVDFTSDVADIEERESDKKENKDFILQEANLESEVTTEVVEEALSEIEMADENSKSGLKEEVAKNATENSFDPVVETPVISDSTSETQSESSEKQKNKIEEIKESIENKMEAVEDKAEEFFDNIEDMFETLFGDEDEEDED